MIIIKKKYSRPILNHCVKITAVWYKRVKLNADAVPYSAFRHWCSNYFFDDWIRLGARLIAFYNYVNK